MSWIKNIKNNVEEMNRAYTSIVRNHFFNEEEHECYHRKLQSLQNRESKIVKSIVNGHILGSQKIEDKRYVDYFTHFQFLIKQKKHFYIEEKIDQRRAIIEGDLIVDDYCLVNEKMTNEFENEPLQRDFMEEEMLRYTYSRLEAVRYAERYWNDYNPVYRKFENNCTNFVSQCLHAGGAPMTGYPNKNKGWWYRQNNWSLSWAVAHSMRWHLSGSKTGLRAREVPKPEQLLNGDVICYDFNGDGRWQHTTIVVAKDGNNMPLVNAQTTNSRMRYWAYEDSTAWTPNIKYKFFTIVDG